MFSTVPSAHSRGLLSSRRWPAVATVLALAAHPAAMAQPQYMDQRAFSEFDLTVLPPYCRAQQNMPAYDGPAGATWRAWLGSDLQHIHHHCRGLRNIYYARSPMPKPHERTELWERAGGEFDYMIRTASPGNPLLPEFHFRRGEVFAHQGKSTEAQASFYKAIAIKADYWPAYAAIADSFIALKMTERAKEVLLQGLHHAPEATPLIERLGKLPGGEALVGQVQRNARANSATAASAPAARSIVPEPAASAPADRAAPM